MCAAKSKSACSMQASSAPQEAMPCNGVHPALGRHPGDDGSTRIALAGSHSTAGLQNQRNHRRRRGPINSGLKSSLPNQGQMPRDASSPASPKQRRRLTAPRARRAAPAR